MQTFTQPDDSAPRPPPNRLIGRRAVICAAVLFPDGVLLVGPRHFDKIMQQQHKILKVKFEESLGICGFLDQAGVFLNREEAYLVAVAANQLAKRPGNAVERLFSEDIY
jgi:hypothetical protein